MNTALIGTSALVMVGSHVALGGQDQRNFGYVTPFDVAGIFSGDRRLVD